MCHSTTSPFEAAVKSRPPEISLAKAKPALLLE